MNMAGRPTFLKSLRSKDKPALIRIIINAILLKSDDIFNFYDHELDDNPISPMAKIFTLTERTEEAKEQHLRLFHSLLGKYI